MNIRCYHIKHRLDLNYYLTEAKKIADYAVKNKKKYFSTKEVKFFNLPSVIKNQILRKYGRGTIKKATNVNLIVPNAKCKCKLTGKVYNTIEYKDGKVYLKPLKLYFNWNSGREFEEIKQVEIDSKKFMICATFKQKEVKEEFKGVLGVDLNCGVGRHIAVCGNLQTREVLSLGKSGPNIRKKYFKKRKKQRVKGDKEKRIMKDLDHKISHKIVNYALQNKLKIIVEDLKGIRQGKRKGNGLKGINRFINSWSFYRLQTFIEYKAKENNIPFLKVPPNYTSQECSYCGIIGERNSKSFICKNKRCQSYRKERNSDVNASFNICKRGVLVLQELV